MSDEYISDAWVHGVSERPEVNNDRPVQATRGRIVPRLIRREWRRRRGEAQFHFKELSLAAKEEQKEPAPEGPKHRLSVYRQGDEMFIDIVMLDEQGGVKSVEREKITHDTYVIWLNHIEEKQGLLFDEQV